MDRVRGRRFHVGRSAALLPLLLAALSSARCGEDCAAKSACDVRAEDCRTCVYERIGRLYGEETESPPLVRFVTTTELAAQLAPKAPPSFENLAYRAGLRRLGLRPIGDATSVDIGSFAAFYAASTKEVTMALDDSHRDFQREMMVLAHEIVHSFQDRAHDLASGRSSSVDGAIAQRALIEGEAVHYEWRFYARLKGWPSVDYPASYGPLKEIAEMRAADPEVDLSDAFTAFVYSFGGEFFTRRVNSTGNDQAATRATWMSPPQSCAEIVGVEAPPAPPFPEYPGLPLVGFSAVTDTSLGSWAVHAFAARLDAPSRSMGAVGTVDRFRTFDTDVPEDVVAIWQIGGLPAALASRLVATINGTAGPAGGAWRAQLDEGGLTVLAAPTPQALTPWIAALGWRANPIGGAVTFEGRAPRTHDVQARLGSSGCVEHLAAEGVSRLGTADWLLSTR